MYKRNPFRALLSFLSGTLLVSSLIIIQSCHHDEKDPEPTPTTPADGQAPEVSFTDLTAQANVWNTVPIKITATDNDEIANVEVFVDNASVAVINQSPYETSWDSNTATDGTHTIKAVATDKTGNKKETQVEVVVKNVLLTIDIADDQLYDFGAGDWSERGFVFLSDENGQLIASTEYTNGNDVSLKAPDFNGEKFLLTEVLLTSDDEDEKYIRLWTFPAIQRGESWVLLDDREDEDEVDAGVANLTFTNLAPESIYYAHGNGNASTLVNEFELEQLMALRKNPSKLYVLRYPNDGNVPLKYGLFSGIDVDAATNTIDLAEVTKDLTKITATLPDATQWIYVEVHGYAAAGDFTEEYIIGSFTTTGNELDIYYPGDAFPQYYSDIEFETDNRYYTKGSNSEIFDLEEIEANVNFSVSGNTTTYDASGEFDFFSSSFENEDETAYWAFILPKGDDQTIPTLELPEAIQPFVTVTPQGAGRILVYNFDDMDDYSGLKSFIKTSTRSIDELYAPGENYFDIELKNVSSGGRIKTTPARKFRHVLRTERD